MKTALSLISRPLRSAAVPSPTQTALALTPAAAVPTVPLIGNVDLSVVVVPPSEASAFHDSGYQSGYMSTSCRRTFCSPIARNCCITHSSVMRS